MTAKDMHMNKNMFNIAQSVKNNMIYVNHCHNNERTACFLLFSQEIQNLYLKANKIYYS